MSGLSPSQWQSLIIGQIGAQQNTDVAAMMSALWDQYAPYAGIAAGRLQALYVKRECIDLMLGGVWEDVDSAIPGDMASKEDQKTAHLRAMRVETEAQITLLEARARGARATAVGQLAATAPAPYVPPDPSSLGLPDPNDPQLAGTAQPQSQLPDNWTADLP